MTTLMTPERPPSAGDRRLSIAIGTGVALVVGLFTLWELRGWRVSSRPLPEGEIQPLTSGAGVETSPTLSPDGEWIAYRGDAAGNGDIYLRRVGENSAVNLTAHSAADDSDPSFSPDGRSIAFRSAQHGGGIYVMALDGEQPRRVTHFGATPAWSPDGRTIVFATRTGITTSLRSGVSEGWKVDVTAGVPVRLSRKDFRQPSVSPRGRRVAYWGVATSFGLRGSTNARADIWTMRLDGRSPVRVTDDEAMDWSPLWSEDGDFLYFVSNRAGAARIWRIGIDERTGRTRGEPVALSVPPTQIGSLTRSADGGRLAWSAFSATRSVHRIPFNRDARSAEGEATAITGGEGAFASAEPSPDGSALVLASTPPVEDIYVARADGSGAQKITDAGARDRAPRWAPDSRRIAFQSDRSGPVTIWIVNRDGTGLRMLARSTGELVNPVWSPDGARIVAWDRYAARARIFPVGDEPASSPIETLPLSQGEFIPSAWSPDGEWIAGTSAGAVWVYSVAQRTYNRIVPGNAPVWLNDSRLLMYAADGRIFMADSVRKFTREIITFPGEELGAPSVSRDERLLYFARPRTEADLWVMTVRAK